MNVGTKSLLFGAHQFLIHPYYVQKAWRQLYGPAKDPRLWIAFVIHDWGYWGKPNMDGPEGERHVEWAANVMGNLFGDEWYYFCLYHSRHYAKKAGAQYSRLCVADKLAPTLEPGPLYLVRVIWSGEVYEYLQHTDEGTTISEWYTAFVTRMRAWVRAHKDGSEDTWTRPGGEHTWSVADKEVNKWT